MTNLTCLVYLPRDRVRTVVNTVSHMVCVLVTHKYAQDVMTSHKYAQDGMTSQATDLQVHVKPPPSDDDVKTPVEDDVISEASLWA